MSQAIHIVGKQIKLYAAPTGNNRHPAWFISLRHFLYRGRAQMEDVEDKLGLLPLADRINGESGIILGKDWRPWS